VIIFCGYRNATADPLVRRLSLRAQDYPASVAPLRIVLFSDVHVHGPDMPPKRVSGIVNEINALKPDVIVAAGDYIGANWFGRRYSIPEAIEPLGGLRARLGVYAVLGNNDHLAGSSEIVRALKAAGIRVLINDSAQAGPLVIGGIDGAIGIKKAKWQERRKQTYAALEAMPGIKLLAVHRPDEFRWVPSVTRLVLAGHTHCGQIVLPLIGPLETGSDYGTKYFCGVVRNRSSLLVVTAGLGTSHLPLRFGAPPDIWLITIGR
jgi:hypothetical protein